MSSNMCAVCDSEYTAEGLEICPDCKDHVRAGEVHFIEIENGSEQEPVRTGRTWQVKKNLVETTIFALDAYGNVSNRVTASDLS